MVGAGRRQVSGCWIILVNWNGGHDTIECLESLMRLDDRDYAVAIVDNGSTDGSVDQIEAWAQARDGVDGTDNARPFFARMEAHAFASASAARITLLESRKNLGFAAANNLGMRMAALDPDALYFWILNNDTVVAPDSLSIQKRRMDADASIGMLGARLMFHHDPDRVQGLAGGFHLWRGRGYHIGLGLKADDLPDEGLVERQMAYVLGASMFVRRFLYERVGGMSEAYFLYYEEIDWATRIKGLFRLAVAHDAVVWHKEGKAIGSATQGRQSDTALYYLQAGLLRFYRRHHPMLIGVACARALREGLGLLLHGDRAGAGAVALAVADVLRGRRRKGRYRSPEFLVRSKAPLRQD